MARTESVQRARSYLRVHRALVRRAQDLDLLPAADSPDSQDLPQQDLQGIPAPAAGPIPHSIITPCLAVPGPARVRWWQCLCGTCNVGWYWYCNACGRHRADQCECLRCKQGFED